MTDGIDEIDHEAECRRLRTALIRIVLAASAHGDVLRQYARSVLDGAHVVGQTEVNDG